MWRRVLGCALAFAALPVPARAGVERTSYDAAMAVSYDSTGRSGVAVTAVRQTTSSGRDVLFVCLVAATPKSADEGCATLPPQAVTTGLGLPDGGRVHVRIPTKRRGGWIEADVTFTATGLPASPPASATPFASGGPSAFVVLARAATMTGTVRTDKGVVIRPSRPSTWFPPMVMRAETATVSAPIDPAVFYRTP